MNNYNIIISLEVRDEKELRDAAVKHYCHENEYDNASEEAKEQFHHKDGTINVTACLVQLADPGMSWPGTSIHASEAEAY